jgi:beta-N-acetylhexosaminidase
MASRGPWNWRATVPDLYARSVLLAPLVLLVSLQAATAPSPYAVNGVDVDAIVERLTVEEKVGQLLLVGFGGTQMDPTIATFLDDMKPGGVALFTRNIDSPRQTVQLIRDVRARDPAGVPMFVAVDQEGGTVVRLKDHATVLPSAMALGAANDVDLARRAGEALGKDLALFGFNMNLAPVLDVNSNPNNPVIGIRSFGEDPHAVAELGVAYVEGLQSAGILAVAKHFPGHGDTDSDSHYHLPVLPHDRARLDEVELLPFARNFAEGLDAIMTAHIALPALGGPEKDLPATVSERVLTSLLRDELGYQGLVMTDGLEMQGIIQRFGSGEAAVRAVLAGADVVMVLWFPEKKREVRDSLLAAVKSGRISKERLDGAVRRVLVAKARRGLFHTKLAPTDDALAQLIKADRSVVNEIAARAITIVKNDGAALPIRRGSKVVVASTEPAFAKVLADETGAKTIALAQASTRERVGQDAQRVIDAVRASEADVVVIAMQTLEHRALVERVKSQTKAKVVVVSFGSPYLSSRLPKIDAYVCAFGWRDESARAAALALVDDNKAVGVLPVTLPGGPKVGSLAP